MTIPLRLIVIMYVQTRYLISTVSTPFRFISKNFLTTILKIYLVKSAISRMASSFLTLLKNIIVTVHQFSFARTTQSSFTSCCNISKGGKRRVIKFDMFGVIKSLQMYFKYRRYSYILMLVV